MMTMRRVGLVLALIVQIHAYSVDLPPQPQATPKVVIATTTTAQQLPAPGVGRSGLPSHTELLLSSSSSSMLLLSAVSTNLVTDTLVNIADINFDGKVPTTEADEYVVIYNGSKTTPADISGYYMLPPRGHKDQPSPFRLVP